MISTIGDPTLRPTKSWARARSLGNRSASTPWPKDSWASVPETPGPVTTWNSPGSSRSAAKDRRLGLFEVGDAGVDDSGIEARHAALKGAAAFEFILQAEFAAED